jgi:hypothetical protein
MPGIRIPWNFAPWTRLSPKKLLLPVINENFVFYTPWQVAAPDALHLPLDHLNPQGAVEGSDSLATPATERIDRDAENAPLEVLTSGRLQLLNGMHAGAEETLAKPTRVSEQGGGEPAMTIPAAGLEGAKTPLVSSSFSSGHILDTHTDVLSFCRNLDLITSVLTAQFRAPR